MSALEAFRSWDWIDAIGWALLHSIWEGAVVAAALAVVLGLLRRASAQARYLAACAAMVLLIALPAAAIFRSETIVSNARDGSAVDRALSGFELSSNSGPDGVWADRRPWYSVVDGVRRFLPAAVVVWTAGISLLSLRLSGGWVQARRLVRLDTYPIANSLIAGLSEQMAVRCCVALLKSSRVEVPMVVGWLRPVILVPVAAFSGLTALEMEAILAHELAHIRRHDYLVNLVQCVIETLMFHHPATWWISRVIRREREHCCDDIAALACRDRIVYARALAAMEGLRVPAFSLSPAASGGNLLARVRRILDPVEESMKPVRLLVAMFVVLALVPIWLVRADEKIGVNPGSARSEPVQAKPVPGETIVDIASRIEEAPTGQIYFDFMSEQDDRMRPGGKRFFSQRGHIEEAPEAAKEARPGESRVILPNGSGDADDPPDEAEVWSKVAPVSSGRPPFYEVQRNNVRIVVEKIGDKIDPVKVYPLAGACQLVHRHYKCTVYFDEHTWADEPTPLNRVDHKVEVVYISKDFLRRAAAASPAGEQQFDVNISHPIDYTHKRRARTKVPAATSRDDRIDGIVREIEQLKRELQSDRQDQDRVLDGLIKELESLKTRDGETQRAPW